MATVYWFRKALRLSDNPSLMRAVRGASSMVPIFVLDPWFRQSGRVGALRYNHLVQTLVELDEGLRKLGSALVILEGSPDSVFPEILNDSVQCVVFEKDTEPYAKKRDAAVVEMCEERGIDVVTEWGHTLYDFDKLPESDSVPTTVSAFQKMLGKLKVPKPLEAPVKLPPLPKLAWVDEALSANPPASWEDKYNLPLEPGQESLIRGGEQIALAKMRAYCSNVKRVTTFEKPKTNPVKAWYSAEVKRIEPGATTALSPYLHFGSLSPRIFYHHLVEVERKENNHTRPPVSLVGQLLWREFFHYVGFKCENFDRIEGNPICRALPWDENEAFLEAWKTARTGFPWIDALMTQLRNEGWLHHLGRHCVACFLTRGDLFVSWEHGARVFEELLVDADWHLNSANWMWLSCSAFFHQYWKNYSPIAFGKKYDPEGEYVKKHLPQLKKYPKKYIYEPWEAPVEKQREWGCVIGEDYPKPIVQHAEASKACQARMKQWFADQKKK